MTSPEILTRLANLSVELSIHAGRLKARMTKPGIPIPDEARDLIGQIRGNVLDLLSDNPAYKRPGLPGRCTWCREWEQAGRHRRSVLACSECDEVVT